MRFFLSFAASVAVTSAVTANPIRRVVNILQSTQKELEEESRKEERLMEKFVCYCNSNNDGMNAEAEAATAKIEELKGQVKRETAEKKQVVQELAQHKVDRKQAKEDLATATAIREKEFAAYEEATSEQRKNIDAFKRAIKALEKGMGKAFLQSTQGVNDRARVTMVASMSVDLDKYSSRVLTSYLQNPYGAYSSKSGEIVGILKTMLEQMDKELGGAISREEEAASQFADLKAAKEKEIQSHTDSIEAKQVRQGELAVAIVNSKNDLKETTKNLGETQAFLAELASQCETKQGEYEERKKIRADEISAISEAIKVLNDDDALDLFNKTLKKDKPAMLLQRSSQVDKIKKAINLLQGKQEFKFGNLLAALLDTRSQKVDFSKVIAMVDEMVGVLGQEQKDDDKHRDFCKAEFNKNAASTKDAKRKIQTLTADIESGEARVEEIVDEISTAEDDIKALDKAVAEATEQRKEEHEDYVQTVAELTGAIQLIGKAINKLNKFYNPALYVPPPDNLTPEQRIAKNLGQDVTPAEGEKIAGTDQAVYAQIRVHGEKAPPPPPETFGAYEKKTGASGGVIALMTKLNGELATDKTTAEHEEKTSQRDYENLMQDSRDKREALVEQITDLESEKADLVGQNQDNSESKANKVGTLEDLNQYNHELHASCDFLLKNFDVRKEARAAELEALKNAKAVLSGASYE